MCLVCHREEEPLVTGDSLGLGHGAVAQLVERLDGIQEVARSTRVGSTERQLLGYTLAGFIAGEGSFSISTGRRVWANGDPVRKFVFAVTVASRDRGVLEELRRFLGVGAIQNSPPRRTGWEPTSTLSVRSLKAQQQAIPFADRFLLPCAKRNQFEARRDALMSYVRRHNIRWGLGRSICGINGCERPVRGRGLCRSHYYRETGW